MIHTNSKVTPIEGGKYHKISGMCTLKHDISSPKFYKLLIKIDIKLDTDIDLNKFYNRIKIYLNAVTRIQGDVLPAYHQIKIRSLVHERIYQTAITFLNIGMRRFKLPWITNSGVFY